MKFNINDKVRVRLTDLGRKTLAVLRTRQNEEVVTAYGPGIALQPIAVPEVDGWSEWVLWDLMATFGAYCWNGGPLVLETEIELVLPEPLECICEPGRQHIGCLLHGMGS